MLSNNLLDNTNSTPNNFAALLSVTLTTQSKIFPCLLASAGVIFFCCTASFLLLKRSFKKPDPNKPSRPKLFQTATMLLGGIAVALALASAVATT
ncbi:hypothetical protein F4779DRAFT_612385 [Xylariaceae sp. FL0662B]|nr:hypothetical protein F4779DRAFT_612385 [Xylariaceae sp. FL0662B]